MDQAPLTLSRPAGAASFISSGSRGVISSSSLSVSSSSCLVAAVIYVASHNGRAGRTGWMEPELREIITVRVDSE